MLVEKIKTTLKLSLEQRAEKINSMEDYRRWIGETGEEIVQYISDNEGIDLHRQR
jgi:hypothetical protein